MPLVDLTDSEILCILQNTNQRLPAPALKDARRKLYIAIGAKFSNGV